MSSRVQVKSQESSLEMLRQRQISQGMRVKSRSQKPNPEAKKSSPGAKKPRIQWGPVKKTAQMRQVQMESSI
ncbi:hypothetical protein BDW22DRAFT_1355450 [Trametopsis cervina]|nr:hypothetical protein BDW22DRAFT_1355450 [Trametopsis cervina]